MIKQFVYRIIRSFSATRLSLAYLHLLINYLKNTGWNKSVLKKMPVDKNGNAIPWFTYSCINFLKSHISKELCVFEYGSGNSSVWLSKNTKSVISVEHDEGWYKIMKTQLTMNNFTYKYFSLESGLYQSEILNYRNEFDIIIIDGRKRVECAINSINALKEDGIIIFDNSDREEYHEAYTFLKDNNFKRIDFEGLSPMCLQANVTSIFYRANNCFNI
jgi:hypothetical protein